MRIQVVALLGLIAFEPTMGFVAPGSGFQANTVMTKTPMHSSSTAAIPEPVEPIVEIELPLDLEDGVTSSMSAPTLQEKTDLLLDLEQYPPGSLPETALPGTVLVLNSWARTASLTGATTASAILERLEQEVNAGNDAMKLTVMHYSVVAHAWAKSDHHQAGVQAEKILDAMIARSELDPSLAPNRIIFNSIIHAWSRQGNTEQAEATFERMKEDPTIDIETGDYNALLSTYARNGNARKAEGVLKDMLESGCEPSIISYNCILDSWRQGDEPGAAERAESILETLQSNFDKGESDIRPNGRSYSSVASAYVKSGRTDSVAQAERLLSLAEERGHAGDSYLYNSVLDAWATSGQKDAAIKAEEVLNDMEKAGSINTVSYNTVIKAWKLSNSRDAAKRAEALLNRMEKLDAEDYRYDVKPDAYTYTAVIQCYTKDNHEGSALKAVSLLNRMIDSCRAGNNELKPNTVTVNVVLDALAKTGDGDSARKAEEILNMFAVSCDSCLDKVSLNTVSYTSVIDAFAKCGTPDAAQKAEEIFAMMEKEFEGGNHQVKPNTRSYNTLLNAWIQTGKKGSVQRAEIILKRMEDEYASGNEDIRPDVVSFSIVMNG
jgi:pentatricopeptide repeat protein